MPKPSTDPSEIEIKDFQYDLPESRIAKFPLKKRDQSKLLIFKAPTIQEAIYHDLAQHIPERSLLIFNQAKVVHARLHFKKPTGGKIEVFCLEPDERYPDITTAMAQKNEVYWKCLLKGAAKWKDQTRLSLLPIHTAVQGIPLTITGTAEKVEREGHSFTIRFRWESSLQEELSFSEFLEYSGEIPIPPYLKRKADKSDEVRYQTIFAKEEGSVAAPTAGLHFTPSILEDLKNKGIELGKLTLHVGAGTFMPVKSEKMKGHEMHSEWIEIPLKLLIQVRDKLQTQNKIICVGTTSARTLESAFWIGTQLLRKEWTGKSQTAVSQWYPYQSKEEYTAIEVIDALIAYFKAHQLDRLITRTRLIIAPGYKFQLLDGLITNFHQPASTLLLMISALVGEQWRSIYQYALDHHFRFLSYGDGSLLWNPLS